MAAAVKLSNFVTISLASDILEMSRPGMITLGGDKRRRSIAVSERARLNLLRPTGRREFWS
jgi:hypothetical protein